MLKVGIKRFQRVEIKVLKHENWSMNDLQIRIKISRHKLANLLLIGSSLIYHKGDSYFFMFPYSSTVPWQLKVILRHVDGKDLSHKIIES